MLNYPRRHATGSFLLEAMIAVILVSLGFLGFARLEIGGLVAANSGLLRSNAIYLSYQMTDRMRANLPGVQAGAYDSMTGSPSSPGCVASSCTPAQMAQNDYYEWNQEAAALLPSGVAVVCHDSTPEDGTPGSPACDGVGDAFTVKVWWSEKGTPYLFASSFRP
jgi:type IV pilus assembly protein PilV